MAQVGEKTVSFDHFAILIMKIVLFIFTALCIFPFIYVVIYSITPYEVYLANPTSLIPSRISLEAYKQLLGFNLIYSGYRNTVIITVVGTSISVLLLLLSAYPLTKQHLVGRKFVFNMIIFTMFFNGGIIPNYILIRGLGLLDSLWALILPQAISAFNLILMKNFIDTIPKSLEESALIDGANEITILFKILAPLSKPAIATFTLFHAVQHWNMFFDAVMYISERDLWPLMLVLREVVVEQSSAVQDSAAAAMDAEFVAPFTSRMAIIVVTILPIVSVYPFLQKYFIKGMLIGGVKG